MLPSWKLCLPKPRSDRHKASIVTPTHSSLNGFIAAPLLNIGRTIVPQDVQGKLAEALLERVPVVELHRTADFVAAAELVKARGHICMRLGRRVEFAGIQPIATVF